MAPKLLPGVIFWPGPGNGPKWLRNGLLEPFSGMAPEIVSNGSETASWSYFLAWYQKLHKTVCFTTGSYGLGAETMCFTRGSYGLGA